MRNHIFVIEKCSKLRLYAVHCSVRHIQDNTKNVEENNTRNIQKKYIYNWIVDSRHAIQINYVSSNPTHLWTIDQNKNRKKKKIMFILERCLDWFKFQFNDSQELNQEKKNWKYFRWMRTTERENVVVFK